MRQSRAASGQAERGLALLLKSFGHDRSGGRFPDPCIRVTSEATRALPFLLGANLALYVHTKLCFLLMLHFESTWTGNVFF